MNQFARNNPELAAQGQFYPGGSPSQNPADHADYCECEICTCECGKKITPSGDCHNPRCKESAFYDEDWDKRGVTKR